MNISLNGKTHSLADNSSLDSLIDALELTGKRIAIEVNDELVPRSAHTDCLLNEGDRVEIVQAIGGG
jgi:sulfur carrier protein